MRIFTNSFLSLLTLIIFSAISIGQQFKYNDSWSNQGIQLAHADDQKVEIDFSIHAFSFSDMEVDRETMQNIITKGHFLPNDEGKPNLPGFARYIAIPEGATAEVRITDLRSESIKDVNIAPAPNIPLDTDDSPLRYEKDMSIYGTDAFFPEKPVISSEIMQIRGVDVILLGITPFRYNPVTKELLVYRDMKVEVSFQGGKSQFGENRLRSRWFDPVLQDAVLNYATLPAIDYNARIQNASRDLDECEYLIVSPNDDVFQQWADSIRQFRIKQGIPTEVITIEEIGGNSPTTIEDFIDSIYVNWEYPPAAILMLGDYGFSGDDRITAPIWENYCASDNIYADVDGDDLPDITLARITAQNADQLEVMVTKFLDHERNPPTNPDFYNEPITALGWQTERWFQICSETVGGYFKHIQGKEPVRINEIYGGNPENDPWSTYSNTPTIMDYFGPDGLGYIPATPDELGNWSGGNATMINNAINSGSFILQHRDHGYEGGWGEPAYSKNSINGLTNTDLTFVMSINCLTGKYNYNGECFTEKFHRYTYNDQNSGALGLIAASEVSYSFVNDTYVWGFYDNLWTDFMPDYGTNPESRGLMPAFGNAAAKYFLQQSSWPANNSIKPVTYHLFHMHGGAFLTLYSEVPGELTVAHNPVLIGGENTFMVTTDAGSFIALTVGDEILATAESEGSPVVMEIEPQLPGDTMIVTITKTNYLRYESKVPVITPDGPYCLYKADTAYDQNNNGKLEYAESAEYSLGIKNYGNDDANNVNVVIRTDDEYITITDSTEAYGLITSGEVKWINKGFGIMVADDMPDQHNVIFKVICTGDDETWTNSYVSTFHAPIMDVTELTIDDSEGDINGRLDPGETAQFKIKVQNLGSAEAYNGFGELSCDNEYIEIEEDIIEYGNIDSGQIVQRSYSVKASEDTPGGTIAEFTFDFMADHNITATDTFNIIVGQYPALIVDKSSNQLSGEELMVAMENYELNVVLTNEFPDEDLIFYKSVFLCLGTYYSNYELNSAESDRLVNYLERGGNLYMEGGTTWSNDDQLDIHDMFNIDLETDNWFTYEEVYGTEATFTAGMYFEYDPATPNNNYHMIAENDAFTLFNREMDEYGCQVANEEEVYKTIGSAVEFGAFVDGETPSTKTYLMKEYLEFFDILDPYVGINNPSTGSNVITAFPNPFNNIITFEISLEKKSLVTFEILDLQGRKITTLANEMKKPGLHKITWDAINQNGSKLSPGVYIYNIQTGNSFTSGKITLLEN